MNTKQRLQRLENIRPAGKTESYPAWQALGLLFEFRMGPYAARLHRAGQLAEVKALFRELIEALAEAAKCEDFHGPCWDLSGIDDRELDWAVSHVGNNLEWLETWHDGTTDE